MVTLSRHKVHQCIIKCINIIIKDIDQTISERALVIREQKPLISNRDLINWAPLSQKVLVVIVALHQQ